MFNREVEATLTIIALSIFADKRVLSTEITAFVKSADIIRRFVTSDLKITEAKLLLWFETNRVDINAKMQLRGDEFERWLDALLLDCASVSDKRFISNIIEHISKADGEVHIAEKALSVMLDRKFKMSA